MHSQDNNYANKRITLEQRLIGLIFGFILGSITFVVWLLIIAATGGGFTTGEPGASFTLYGPIISLAFGLILSVYGFLFGCNKLADLFGILWGTDQRWRQTPNLRNLNVPTLPLILTLLVIIILSWGYALS